MTTNEVKVLSIIWNWGGEASLDIIARQAGVNIEYARVLCESLEVEGCIDFLRSKLCKIKDKGKIAVAGKKNAVPPKIVISEGGSSGLRFGKKEKGAMILEY